MMKEWGLVGVYRHRSRCAAIKSRTHILLQDKEGRVDC